MVPEMTDEQKEKIFDAILNVERNDAVIVQLDPFAIEVFKDCWSDPEPRRPGTIRPFAGGGYVSIPCETALFKSGGLTTTGI